MHTKYVNLTDQELESLRNAPAGTILHEVGFPGERLLQRIIRELATDAAGPEACNEIAKSLVEVARQSALAAFAVADKTLGPALYQAVQRLVKFQTSMGATMATEYSSIPNVLAEQLLNESNSGNVMSGPAVGGWLSSITDLIAKLQSVGLDLNAIIALVTKAIPLIKAGDWLGVIQLILEQFAKTSNGPVITGG